MLVEKGGANAVAMMISYFYTTNYDVYGLSLDNSAEMCLPEDNCDVSESKTLPVSKPISRSILRGLVVMEGGKEEHDSTIDVG